MSKNLHVLANAKENSDQITLLVFKSNYPARTFEISLNWISQLGLYFSILVLFTGLSTFFAIKYYYFARVTHTEKIQQLEEEISSLKSHAHKFEDSSHSNVLDPQIRLPEPMESITSTELVSSPKETPLSPLLEKKIGNWINPFYPNPSNSLKMNAFRIEWKKDQLQVDFALQQTQNAKKIQQGYIIILARGPDLLLTYPTAILNKSTDSELLQYKKGEYFSFNHYREVHAIFPSLTDPSRLEEIEILIFNKNKEILLYKNISITNPDPSRSTPGDTP